MKAAIARKTAEEAGEEVTEQSQALGSLDLGLDPMGEVSLDVSHGGTVSSSDSSFPGFTLSPRVPAKGPSPKPKDVSLKSKAAKKIVIASLGQGETLSTSPSHESPSVLSEDRPVGSREMAALVQQVVQASMKDLRSGLVEELRSYVPAKDPSLRMPLAADLPQQDPMNPWRDGRYVNNDKGTLFVEGLGFRPISDFDFFPGRDAFPYCWLRLSPEASVRTDKVPRETVIYPLARAQSCALTTYGQMGGVNTTKNMPGCSYTMFLTPPDMVTPFSSKAFDAVLKAVPDKSGCPKLKEWDSTSPIFPGDSEAWKGVAETFTVGRLDKDCASTLFNEDLPKLPDAMLKTEAETKARLARSLHTLALMESFIHLRDKDEAFCLLAKTHGVTVMQDLYAFTSARRALREHIFEKAKVRHEPTRLINSPIWGSSLFPAADVRETLDGAEKANQSLGARWGLTFGSQKRKAPPQGGHQPQRMSYKKFRWQMQRAQLAHLPLPPPPPTFNVPPPPYPAAPVPSQPAGSPAYNPYFEAGPSGFRGRRYGNQGGHQGGRGRGAKPKHQGRGKGQGHRGRGKGPGPAQ